MKTTTKPPRRKSTAPASGKPASSAAPLPKIDLNEQFKSEYVAPKKPVLIDTQPGRYLSVRGTGGPGGGEFEARIGALYSMAFTVKMTRKFGGQQDYTIGRLEARYLNFDREPMPPQEKWQWQLLIRIPEFVTADELSAAVAALRKRGKEGDAALVAIESIEEGRCVQMLHVGPYDREGETVEEMCRFAKAQGLKLEGPHHEIYVSDPRRVAPEKLKTILRRSVVPERRS